MKSTSIGTRAKMNSTSRSSRMSPGISLIPLGKILMEKYRALAQSTRCLTRTISKKVAISFQLTAQTFTMTIKSTILKVAQALLKMTALVTQM